MMGSEDMPKTLEMMHEAAIQAFEEKNYEKGIDILNDAHVLEKKLGFKNKATESMVEIATAYTHLKNYDLALWFAQEALDILPPKHEPSTKNKITNLLATIQSKTQLSTVS